MLVSGRFSVAAGAAAGCCCADIVSGYGDVEFVRDRNERCLLGLESCEDDQGGQLSDMSFPGAVKGR